METIRNHPITRFWSSYILGIVVLAWMMVLLVIGTLYQEHWGIYRAKQMFFDTWIFLYPVSEFIRSLPAGLEETLAPISKMGIRIPLPGNALLTFLLFINLLTATLFRMRYRHKIIGVYVVHAGILILIGGAFATNYFAYESYMRIPEGEASNYSARYHKKEIALYRQVDETDAATTDEVISIANLENMPDGKILLPAEHPVPFSLELVELRKDCTVDNDPDGDFGKSRGLNHGFTQKLNIVPFDLVANPDATPMAAVIEAKPDDGGEPMRFILSDMLLRPVEIEAGGDVWKLDLRDYRHYHDYSVYLRDFIRETHAGTSMAARYESKATFMIPDEGVEKDVRIYMNHPLRHKTFTFYQQSFEQGDKVTVLAVVNNPGMPLPYVATIVIAAGLLIQFIYAFAAFRKKMLARQQREAANA